MVHNHQQQPDPSKEAMIYRRVSAGKAEHRGESLEQQETDIRNSCGEDGLIIVDVFREAGNGEPRTLPAEHREEK